MVTVLGGLAEFERSLIKARTDVGIKRARDAGIRFGRPPTLTKHQPEQARRLLDGGEPRWSFAIMACPSAANRHRRTAVPSMM